MTDFIQYLELPTMPTMEARVSTGTSLFEDTGGGGVKYVQFSMDMILTHYITCYTHTQRYLDSIGTGEKCCVKPSPFLSRG